MDFKDKLVVITGGAQGIVSKAECYQKGDLPLSNLLSKYCTYMVVSNRG